jgi:UDP-hydrolysing UDP-N-acetyl-D-glucosamine 2-epimerase|tara:strand:- start:306 stop:1448 length:1143 start_codon:yes stop_codon:yes gene_type:complete
MNKSNIKKILFFSAARSDFGILSGLLNKLSSNKMFNVGIIISGSHLDKSFGDTGSEIKDYHYDNIFKVKTTHLGSDSTSKNLIGLANMMQEVGKIIENETPDLFMVLGDRQEILLATYCALLNNIKIAHIAGGDTTLGAIDNQIRHAVSQMSDYHFVLNDDAFNFLSKLNIEKEKIFLSGSPSDFSISKIKSSPPLKQELLEKLEIKDRKNLLVCTYHPETKKKETYEDLKILLGCLSTLDKNNFSIVFTASNGDREGKKFNKLINETCKKSSNFYFFKSLGIDLYLQLVYISQIVIGNSSSGLHEVPSLNVPTLDIGNRQEGRTRGLSVFNVKADSKSILKKINTLLEKDLKIDFSNPYITRNDSSQVIHDKIQHLLDR